LDIGCATGELAFQLAVEGAIATGIDLNKDLLDKAVLNKKHPNLNFQFGNMLELGNDFPPSQFDVVLCFGNTLVHLETIELITKMLKGSFAVLKAGGHTLLQILNYDYILAEKVTELPLIETENIRFIRKYKIEDNNPLIRFQTELELKIGKNKIANETSLLALQSIDLIRLLHKTGFRKIELFSNFKQEAFGGNHFPLVVSCRK